MRNFYTELNLDSAINSQALLSASPSASITLAVSTFASPGNSIIYHKPPLEVFGIIWYWWLLIAISGIVLIVLVILTVRYLLLRKPTYLKALDRPVRSSTQVSVKDEESSLIGR